MPLHLTGTNNLSWHDSNVNRQKTYDRCPIVCGSAQRQHPNSFTVSSGEFIRDMIPPPGYNPGPFLGSELPPPLNLSPDTSLSHFEIYPHRLCALAPEPYSEHNKPITLCHNDSTGCFPDPAMGDEFQPRNAPARVVICHH